MEPSHSAMKYASDENLPYYTLSDFNDVQILHRADGRIIYKGYGKVQRKEGTEERWVAVEEFSEKYSYQWNSHHLKRLIDVKHPNLVEIYGMLHPSGDEAHFSGIVREYHDGKTLDDLIYDSTISYDWQQICIWISEITSGLKALHKDWVEHGNLKPKKIILSGDLLKLTGYGKEYFEKIFDRRKSRNLLDVDIYTAPEVFILGDYRGDSDIYSLAITIWEIFHRKTPSLDLDIDPNKINQDVAELVQRCWAPKPKRRPSVDEIRFIFKSEQVEGRSIESSKYRKILGKREKSSSNVDWEKPLMKTYEATLLEQQPKIDRLERKNEIWAEILDEWYRVTTEDEDYTEHSLRRYQRDLGGQIDKAKKEKKGLAEYLKKLGYEEKTEAVGNLESKDDSPIILIDEATASKNQLEIDELLKEKEALTERLRKLNWRPTTDDEDIYKQFSIKAKEKFTSFYLEEIAILKREHGLEISKMNSRNQELTGIIEKFYLDPKTSVVTKCELEKEEKFEKPQGTTIVLIGGMKNDHTGYAGVTVLSSDRSKWTETELELPYEARGSGAVYLNDEIYLFGGFRNSRALYKLINEDNQNFRWIQLADMNVGRTWITNSCLVWNGCIWVFGGKDDDYYRLKSVERYDPRMNKWTLMPEMNDRRSGAAAVLWKDTIFITGGFSNNERTDTVECFDLEDNFWVYLPSMPRRLSNHSFIFYKKKLLAIGGHNILPCSDIWEIDPYKINAKWNPLTEMRYPTSHFGGVVLDNEIYCIGGCQENCPHDRVEIYNGQCWRDGPSLPYRGGQMSSVIIPQSLAEILTRNCFPGNFPSVATTSGINP